jgi:serine/threonine protein kinase
MHTLPGQAALGMGRSPTTAYDARQLHPVIAVAQLTNLYCGPYQLDERVVEEPAYDLYDAHHSEDFRKRYRVKVLKPNADAAAREQLVREHELLTVISCSGIPNVFKLGQVKTQDCMVMEHITGNTIGQMVANGDPFDRLAAFVTAVKLIAFLHDHHFLHNRVNPEAFTLRDRDAKLYLTDFSRISVTAKGGLLGGLFKKKVQVVDLRGIDTRYAAPEVLAGKPPSPKSDVYSLGELAFLLLGNAGGENGGSRTSTQASGRTRAVIGQSVAPSSRNLAALQRQYAKNTPRELIELIECCLRQNIDFRPTDAVTLLHDVWPIYAAQHAAD